MGSTELVCLDIPAQPAFVGVARSVIATVATAIEGIGDERLEDLRLAVSEACTNAVEAGTDKRIILRAVQEDGHLEVLIEDSGRALGSEGMAANGFGGTSRLLYPAAAVCAPAGLVGIGPACRSTIVSIDMTRMRPPPSPWCSRLPSSPSGSSLGSTATTACSTRCLPRHRWPVTSASAWSPSSGCRCWPSRWCWARPR
ncbi:MAG: ATP-binding protein [Acidobacteria bacterium]|nr:ATP-binding protein [Acidobacteriota bacterium]